MKLIDMQKDPTGIHTLSADRAAALITAGLAKPVVVDPMPESGIPVTLTGLGRSAVEAETVADETVVGRKKQ